MFINGFRKLAVAVVTMTPEEYFETVGEKDPYMGAVGGATLGALHGLRKGKKGVKSKAGLIGAAVGGAAGATAGHYGGKLLRHYQTHKVRRMAEELKLRSTPNRKSYQQEEE